VAGEGFARAFAYGLAQAAFDTVADDGVADFLGDGEAKARDFRAYRVGFGAFLHLQDEYRRDEFDAAGGGEQEIATLFNGGESQLMR